MDERVDACRRNRPISDFRSPLSAELALHPSPIRVPPTPDPAPEGQEFAALLKLVDEYENQVFGETDPPSPGTVVRQRIEQLGLSQKELAEETDIPESRISEIVNDNRLPSRRQIEKLSGFFDIPADLLISKNADPAAAE